MVGMNDYTLDNFRRTVDVWYNMYPVFNDCEQLRQPIYFNDVAQCVLNALKLHESCGQTYELGGPNVYTRREMFEIMINLLDRPISLQYVNKDLATMFAKYFVNWRYFSLDQLKKDELDLVVTKQTKTIEDLFVKPVSFSVVAEKVLAPYAARYRKDHERNEEH